MHALEVRTFQPSFRDEFFRLTEVAGVVVDGPSVNTDFGSLWDPHPFQGDAARDVDHPLHAVKPRGDQAEGLVDTGVEVGDAFDVSELGCVIRFVFEDILDFRLEFGVSMRVTSEEE